MSDRLHDNAWSSPLVPRGCKNRKDVSFSNAMCISLHVNPSSGPVRDAVFQSAADGASVLWEDEWRAVCIRAQASWNGPVGD